MCTDLKSRSHKSCPEYHRTINFHALEQRHSFFYLIVYYCLLKFKILGPEIRNLCKFYKNVKFFILKPRKFLYRKVLIFKVP